MSLHMLRTAAFAAKGASKGSTYNLFYSKGPVVLQNSPYIAIANEMKK